MTLQIIYIIAHTKGLFAIQKLKQGENPLYLNLYITKYITG